MCVELCIKYKITIMREIAFIMIVASTLSSNTAGHWYLLVLLLVIYGTCYCCYSCDIDHNLAT